MRIRSDFHKLWVGNAFSNLADGITFVVIPLLALSLTSNPLAIAGLATAYSAPRVVAILGIGVMVDRVNRHHLLSTSSFLRASIFALLTVLVGLNMASVPLLYVIVGALGLIETIADSSAFAVLPQVVEARDLDKANAQIASTQIVADEFVGPPLGGFLVALAALVPLGVNGLVLAVAGFSYLSLRGDYTLPPATGRIRPRTVRADVLEGARWLVRNEVILLLAIVSTLTSLGYMIPFSYLALYAREVLDLDATGYGLLLSVAAIGGLTGSWAAERLRRRMGYGYAIISALLVGAVTFGTIAASGSAIVVAVSLAAYVGHAVAWNVLTASIRQRIVPPELMGRVSSVGRLLGLIGLLTGSLIGGLLAGAFGMRVPFVIAATLFVIAAGLVRVRLGHVQAWERSQRAVLALPG